LALIAASVWAAGVFAQDVDLTSDPLPPISDPDLAPITRIIQPDLPSRAAVDSQVAQAPDPAAREASSMPRRFRYELEVNLRAAYDDNVTLAQDDRQEDFYALIAPKIVLGFGDVTDRHENYVLLNYAPSAYFFVDNSGFNTVEHIAHLEGQWRLSRLVLSLAQDIRSVQSSNLDVAGLTGGFVNQTNLDVGGRQRLNTYATHLDAQYELTGKTSARAGLEYVLADYEDLIGSEIISGTVGLDYIYSPKLTVGLEARVGKSFVDAPSPDQTFEQISLRSNYELTGKLKATGSAGVEFRQSDAGTHDNVSPIFEIGVAYQPFDGTEIKFNTTRRTLNSATLNGQDFTSTQFVFSAQQRLLQRMYPSLTVGYQNQTYFSTVSGLSSTREDNYYFIAPGFDVKITNFWFGGVYYLHRANDSSFNNFSFDNNQIGVRSSLVF
jgi:hypothetical protein